MLSRLPLLPSPVLFLLFLVPLMFFVSRAVADGIVEVVVKGFVAGGFPFRDSGGRAVAVGVVEVVVNRFVCWW